MMTVNEIMTELQSLGSEGIKKIFLKHGIKEPLFGVKISDLKTLQKKIKKDYQLALDLYGTGNADAMYLAGLTADDEKMTKADLQKWVELAISNNISEYTVPWVAAGSKFGYEIALEWIENQHDYINSAGWCTLGNIAALKADHDLNIHSYRILLSRVIKTIHTSGNRVRHCMNNFVINVGSYIIPLTEEAIDAASKIGVVYVDMNGTSCKTPNAAEYITKVNKSGKLGKKKKTVKC